MDCNPFFSLHFYSCLKVQEKKRKKTGMTNFYCHKLYVLYICVADDRGVRDRERQAALIHFSSGQATEMTHHPPRKEPAQKCPHPRVELTAKLGKPSGEIAQQLCGYLYASACMHVHTHTCTHLYHRYLIKYKPKWKQVQSTCVWVCMCTHTH